MLKREIISIQYLRGIAALLIVFVHLDVQLERFGIAGYNAEFCNSGVDLFFVISGFIMWTTTQGQRVLPLDFMRKRAIRIVPLYWLITTLMVFFLLAAPSLVKSGTFDSAHILKSYFFVASPHPVTHGMQPVLIPGWTLNYEMFFYLIFAFCLLLAERLRAIALIACIVVLTGLHPLFPDSQTIGHFYTSSIMLEFGFGVAVGVMLTANRRMDARLAIAAMLLGIAGIMASGLYAAPRAMAYGIPAGFIVLGAVMYERNRTVPTLRPLHILGDASYSLYLSHGLVLSALGQIWIKLGLSALPGHAFVFVPIAVALACLVSVAIYHYVERPAMRLFRKKRSSPQPV